MSTLHLPHAAARLSLQTGSYWAKLCSVEMSDAPTHQHEPAAPQVPAGGLRSLVLAPLEPKCEASFARSAMGKAVNDAKREQSAAWAAMPPTT